MKYIKIIFILSLLVILLNCKKQNNIRKPNIIFFIADDMYPEMFNFLAEGKGKNLTPNLDRLASEGTIMMNQYVVSPVCTPSRYNVLTGNYASRAVNKKFLEQTKNNSNQTVIKWNTFLTPEDTTITHYLKKMGYKTGFAGKNHVYEVNGLERFADYWADPKKPEINRKVRNNYDITVKTIIENGYDYVGGVYHNNPNFIGLGELAVQNMDWIAQSGIEFIDKYHSNPFFLYFATTIPHQPEEPERSWKASPLITAQGYLDKAPDVLPPRETLPKRIKEAGLEGKNKELVLWLDDALGAILNKLEQHKILDNTIIFFFNDHGQKAKGTLYQGGIHNPSLIWKKGGFPCGNVCHAKIQNIDFAPTILHFTGANDVDGIFDGNSILPLLQNQEKSIHESLFFELGFARAIIKNNYKYLAVRYPENIRNMTPSQRAGELNNYNNRRIKKNMKIVNTDPTAPMSHFSIIPGGEQAENESYGKKPAYFEKNQLYNLNTDPDEQVNLAKQYDYQDIMLELKEGLKEYLNQLPGNFEIENK